MNKVSLLFIILSIYSCKNNENKLVLSENEGLKQKDTTVLTKHIENQILKSCNIDDNYFDNRTKLAKALTNDEIIALNLTIIEDIDRDLTAKIKIIDTLFSNLDNKMIVVSQESENESKAYIVNLNKKGKAFQFEPVYYTDVVEYFSSTSSKIKDNTILIITESNNGEEKSSKETVTLHFVNGKIEK